MNTSDSRGDAGRSIPAMGLIDHGIRVADEIAAHVAAVSTRPQLQ